MAGNPSCSLVLAAHGSVTTPCANQPLYDLASRAEASGIFSNVTPAFLYGDPQISDVLDRLPSGGDVVVVPVMTSEGYYSQRVFPKKLAENNSLDQHRLFISTALGMHPKVPDMVADRIEKMLGLLPAEPNDFTVVFIGHGTTRNKKSGRATMDLAAAVQGRLSPDTEQRPVIRVAFLDQPPTASVAAARVKTAHTLVVPYLVSRGPHTTVDVPEAFGLPSGPTIKYPLVETFIDEGSQAERLCICDTPVGMYAGMSELVLELATDQMMSGKPVDLSELVPNPDDEKLVAVADIAKEN
jgi:sirohydrochlorin cobaltochelatase